MRLVSTFAERLTISILLVLFVGAIPVYADAVPEGVPCRDLRTLRWILCPQPLYADAVPEGVPCRDLRTLRWILCPQPRGDWDKEVEGFSKRNDFAGAERAARRWVQMAPTDAMAHNGLAQALVGQKRYDEALTAAREALRLAPDHRIIHDRYTELLNVQGDRLTQQGRLRGAEDLYREARQVNPGEQRYLTDLRDNLLKQFQEALRAHDSRWGVEVARKLVHLEPSNPRHHIRLGRALIQTGDSAGGQAAFQEAVRRRNAVGRQ